MPKYSHFPPQLCHLLPLIPSLVAINNPATESLSLLSSITVPHTGIPGIYSQRRRNGGCDSRRNDAGEFLVPDVHCGRFGEGGVTLKRHLCVYDSVCMMGMCH